MTPSNGQTLFINGSSLHMPREVEELLPKRKGLHAQYTVRPNNTKTSEFGTEKCLLQDHARRWMDHALRAPLLLKAFTKPEEGAGLGTHVHLWRIHVDVWQNQYNIIK